MFRGTALLVVAGLLFCATGCDSRVAAQGTWRGTIVPVDGLIASTSGRAVSAVGLLVESGPKLSRGNSSSAGYRYDPARQRAILIDRRGRVASPDKFKPGPVRITGFMQQRMIDASDKEWISTKAGGPGYDYHTLQPRRVLASDR
jgi:hypothetical protein